MDLFGQLPDHGGRLAAGAGLGVIRAGDGWMLGPGGSGGFPPGSWEIVGYVPAMQQDHYAVVVPTTRDSTGTGAYNVYAVSAHTTNPTVFFVSRPDSGFSVDNTADVVAPSAPADLLAVAWPDGNVDLRWRASAEPDFLFYRVYRDPFAGFTPSLGNRVHQTFDTTWTDPTAAGTRIGQALVSQLLVNLGALRVDTLRTDVRWQDLELLVFLMRCGFAPAQRLSFSMAID